MTQFSLDKYLENTTRKVVTRRGNPVRIVCWDSPNKAFPIMGFIDNEPEIFVWDCFGYCCEGHIETEFDLFFADEEESMNEFEARIYNLINFSDPDNYPSIKEVKEEAEILLDLAKEKILKDFPKWKQMPNGIQGNGDFKPTYLVKSYGNYLITPCISWDKDSMYIELSELEKLPKE